MERKEFVLKEINKFMEGTLNYVEVSIGNAERYNALRKKILRLGNDCLRAVSSEFDVEKTIEKEGKKFLDRILGRNNND